MKKINKSNKGFTLAEIMVVVFILAIMSTTTYVGFGSFRESIIVEQSTEVLRDIVEKVEQDHIQGKYNKSTIYFKALYLIIISEPVNMTLNLNVDSACNNNNIGVTSRVGGQLKKQYDNSSSGAFNLLENTNECEDFINSKNTEWKYSLSDGGEISPIIRFIKYNPDIESNTFLTVKSGIDNYMVIEGNYLNKTFFDSSDSPISNITITLTDLVSEKSEDVVFR